MITRFVALVTASALFAAIAIVGHPLGPAVDRVEAATTSSSFVATTPCRLADSRNGTGIERVDAQIVRVFVAGRCGVPNDASAVALTVTADNGRSGTAGFVTIWPEGQPTPTASIVNYGPGEVRANGAVVTIGVGGAVDLLTPNGAPVIVDVTGWFLPATAATAGRFVPITPTRAIDTREPPRSAPVLAGQTLRVPLPAAVPSTASAVAVTITITEPAGPGFLTVAPAGAGTPPTSVVNVERAKQTRASGTIVGVSADGLEIYSQSTAHVVVDITGWFTGADAESSTVGLFVPAASPRRLLDSRTADPIWRDQELEVANVSGDAAALLVNVAILLPHRLGFLTAHPARRARPATSTVNAGVANETAAAMAVVPTTTAGVGVYASGGADVIVDLAGYFLGNPGGAELAAPANVRPPDCAFNSNTDGLASFFASGVVFKGADYQRAFALPDGRTLWVFQDVYLRTRTGSRFVHNAGLVQDGTCFTLLQTGTFAQPGAWLFADQTQTERHWFWPLAGDIGVDGRFHLFVAEMRENTQTYLGQTEPTATWVVTIDPTTLQVTDRRKAVDAGAALYGWSVTSSDQYTYLYAHCHRQFGWSAFPFVSPPVYIHDLGCASRITVARVPRGQFDQPLSYWNGSTWSADPGSAVNIVPGDRFVSAGQFFFRNGAWVSVTKLGDWFGDKLLVEVASRPQGPFRTVQTIVPTERCGDCNTYAPTLLPYPDGNGNWIVGISNNSFTSLDLRVYDPTFLAIPPVSI